jgi:branched-chain amino acid transport system ATP-binding protein
MRNILSVRGVEKSFGSLKALDGVSLDVEEKTITMLIGPNGSGKSTLINVVMGLHKPDAGTVTYESTDITGWPPHKLYRLGLARTFQIPALFWDLTVLENLLVASKDHPGESFLKAPFKGTWMKQEEEQVAAAGKVLSLLGLSAKWNQPAYQLSGGQMKLVELGRALMSGAKFLCLDEPISGVNPTLAHEIFGKILRLRDELGISFFIVEHRLDIAISYVDRMHAMAYGKLLASGTPEEVVSDARVVEAYLGA